MSEPIDPQRLEQLKRRAWVWPAIVIALLSGHLLVGAVSFYIANSDPSVAIEPDYYKKALDWDRTAAQMRVNAELGWSTDLSVSREADPRGRRTVALAVRDASGEPIRGAQVTYEAFAQARANRRLTGVFDPREPGVYAADLLLLRDGMWEFRFTIERGEQRFTCITRQHVWPVEAARK
ncbi:MAG: hypothetical protein D6744_00935 [Planctomycetota bacterium]|nr:MAG: hypothetical protein D6744_00935 [Planctomycetota bacterium]